MGEEANARQVGVALEATLLTWPGPENIVTVRDD